MLLLAVASAALVPAARADHDPKLPLAGTWETSTGEITFTATDARTGASEVREHGGGVDADGKPNRLAACPAGAQYYVGWYTAGPDRGYTAVCGSGSRYTGWYLADGGRKCCGVFTVNISGNRFTGSYYWDWGDPEKRPPARPWSGTFDEHIPSDGTEPEKLCVQFKVLARGKPNIPIGGAPNPAGMTTSRIRTENGQDCNGNRGSWVRATFTKKKGNLLEATETKGKVVHEDAYTSRSEAPIVFSIHQGSVYQPNTRRLSLALKADSSNDPGCPKDAGASLTIVPRGGVADAVFFVGTPYRQKIKTGLGGFFDLDIEVLPCKGHAHGWEKGSGRVTVLVVMQVKKL